MKRINELVKRELSSLIRERLPVERHGLISVTEVDVAKDLKVAHVYVSAVAVGPQQAGALLGSLERIRADLQHELARKVVIKYTPHLTFKWDDGLERGQHMVEVLENLDSVLDGKKTLGQKT